MSFRSDIVKAAALAAGIVAAGAVFGASDNAEAAGCGPSSPWQGFFSGDYYDQSLDWYRPVSARGCFRTERACRRFINRKSGGLNGGPIRVMSCRREG